jgi:alkylation response protein AidB-like acyl-CoA dehydrogenase
MVLDGSTLEKRRRELGEQAQEVVKRVVVPLSSKLLPGERLSNAQMRELYRGLAPLGYLGGTIPREAGGAGMSTLEYGLLLEALAHSPVMLSEVVPPRTVFYLGDERQRARWLPPLLAGEIISTAAITEPQAGSDLRAMRTSAERVPEGYVLRGKKAWIKFGGVADAMTVLAITDPEKGHKGASRLFVERKTSPWTVRELPCVGIRNLSFAEVTFESSLVPAENMLGSASTGVEGFYRGVEVSRALVGLQASGMARAALDRAEAYAGKRVAFGRAIGRFQAIQIALAEAASRVEAARALSIKALQILDDGRRCPREASMAKVFATETAVDACGVAMSTMGAFGLSEEAGVERCWRDAKMLTVIDGTSDIQRLIIGREELGVPAFT